MFVMSNTGFKGRIGIYELLFMDAQISELVLIRNQVIK